MFFHVRCRQTQGRMVPAVAGTMWFAPNNHMPGGCDGPDGGRRIGLFKGRGVHVSDPPVRRTGPSPPGGRPPVDAVSDMGF